MIAKVRHYKLISNLFDSIKGENIIKQDMIASREVNIVFDENMYIEYPSNFEKELFSLTVRFINEKYILDNLKNLEYSINALLKKYRDMKMLHIESDLSFTHKEGMIVLYGDNYFDNY